jgi:hypothetical protein
MRTRLMSAIFLAGLSWSSAFAGLIVPSPGNSTVPASVVLVGSDGASADPFGAFMVVVRDYNNSPIQNSLVSISFENCSYVGICPDQLDPGIAIVDCPGTTIGFPKTIGKFTNRQGFVTFSLIGTASPSDCPSDPPGCATIYADGVVLGHPSVAALDLDGIPGLSGEDLAQWLGGFLCGSGSPRLDYNGFGVSGGDLSLWLASYLGTSSSIGCATALCK